MSDFIYSRDRQRPGVMSGLIRSIYADNAPTVSEHHGDWGSLAVSRNLHQGFQPLETDRHVCIVIGGPVLTFAKNAFLTGDDPTAGSSLILTSYASGIEWDRDLSGPFAILLIDKGSGEIRVVTDMMSFIPVYRCSRGDSLYLGTHADALAKAAGIQDNHDYVSVADYVLAGCVTFPYTIYQGLQQLNPATDHRWSGSKPMQFACAAYWRPTEELTVSSLGSAADSLRQALKDYVEQVAAGMDKVACFVSGGEDSRVVLSLLPRERRRDAFIFVDSYNREARIAQQCCDAFGAHLEIIIREPSTYLNILDDAARLMGSGWEARHAHVYGLRARADLRNYAAVFGGYLSDSYLKGHHIKKLKLTSLPFAPQLKRPQMSPADRDMPNYFAPEVMKAVHERRVKHFASVKALRPKSAAEWYTLWPASMRITMASFQSNRRLIRSYEPFMASGVLKISAGCPQRWKLNRRLFQRMAQPLLEPVKWLPHSSGSMPYFPWTNVAAQFSGWVKRAYEVSKTSDNQGAWTTLDELSKTQAWTAISRVAQPRLISMREGLSISSSKDPTRWPIKYQMRLIGMLSILDQAPASKAESS